MEDKMKQKIKTKFYETGHCRIIYKNISNVTILSSSSQSVPNILECSITKQHVSRFTLCRPFFSLRIKQYIYIYISRKYLLETWHGAKEKYSSLPPPPPSPSDRALIGEAHAGKERKGERRRDGGNLGEMEKPRGIGLVAW